MTKRFKLIAGVVIAVGLILLAWQILKAGDEWSKTATPDYEYGILTAPHQYSRLFVADTTHKHISLDSTEYSRDYINTHTTIEKFILRNKWVANDSMYCSWTLQGTGADTTGAVWTTIATRAITRLDSAVTYYDTTVLHGNDQFTYYRYAFAGAANNKQGGGVQLDWKVTIVGMPNDYWIAGGAKDTTPTIYAPAGFNYWSLWYKCQRADSIKVWIRALVSYDNIFWVKADSITSPANGYDNDSLLHFRILTLPKALFTKFEIAGDTGNGHTCYIYTDTDSSGFNGTLVRMSYIQGR